jgi:hypothetical protein
MIPTTPEGFESLMKEALDPEKVILTCGIHGYSYGAKHSRPSFRCKQCQMVSFMGLLANTAPEKRQETVEMLEYTVHKLIEADKRGDLNRAEIMRRPLVTVERDGQIIFDSSKPKEVN